MKLLFKYAIIAFLAAACTFAVTSCDKDSNETDEIQESNIQESDFVGAWQDIEAEENEEIFVVLKSDGTGYTLEIDEYYGPSNESFRWYYNERFITIINPQERKKLYVENISKNLMVLSDSEGTYPYRRIKESDIPDYKPDDENNNNDEEDNNQDNEDNSQNSSIKTLSVEPHAFRATLSGQYSGKKQPERVGFEYSYYSNFPSEQSASTSIEGTFERYDIEVKGLVDQMKIYYRAFAVINGETIYGGTKHFETTQGTYTLNGNTYKFIKLTGLPTGSFSMMQTELPPDAEIEIDGVPVHALDVTNDGIFGKGEMRDYLDARTPVLLRYPSTQEWLYAASGGSVGKGFVYSGSNDINEVAWYSENSNGHAAKPAQKLPNELGFYDMSGNYAELCMIYDDEQLEGYREVYTKKFIYSIKEMSSKYFESMWNAFGGAYGGYWGSTAVYCVPSSSVAAPTPDSMMRSYISGKKYTVRFVYSRPD